MTDTNRITMADLCIDGNVDFYKNILDPMYEQFVRFYKVYKDTFKDREDSVKNIIFSKEDDNVASFHVMCDEDVTVCNDDKKIVIHKREKEICFNVHPNKEVNL